MSEIAKMKTPWDSDHILMVDVGCFERGCMGVHNHWDNRQNPECVPVVEYKEWVDLTDEDIQDALPGYRSVDAIDIARVIEAKLKEKNNA